MKILDNHRLWVTVALALLAYWGPLKLPELYVWLNPPFVVGEQPSITVTVSNGVPVEVAEVRSISRSFDGRWETRAIHITNGDVICPQIPLSAPVEESYHKTSKPSFSASWASYTGDYTGECLERLKRNPGVVMIETFRWAWVWWRWVRLDTAQSAPFQVGAGADAARRGDEQ